MTTSAVAGQLAEMSEACLFPAKVYRVNLLSGYTIVHVTHMPASGDVKQLGDQRLICGCNMRAGLTAHATSPSWSLKMPMLHKLAKVRVYCMPY